MKLCGLENTVLNSSLSLHSLLRQHFPDISSNTWEVSSLEGLSGGSYLVRSSQINYPLKLIARADGVTQSALYVNRRKEARILNQLHDFTYSPGVIGLNHHWLLLEWCEGEHPDTESFLSPRLQCQLAYILAQLHSHSLLGYRLPLRNEILHYGYLIDNKRLSPRWKKLHHYFSTVPLPRILKLAPAHMDIHRGNILCQQGHIAKLLDWEYAANTDIAFSLETYFQFNSLTDGQKDFFLTQYCDIHGAYRDKIKLANHCKQWEPWVKYMTLMWYEVQWKQRQEPQFLIDSSPLRHYFSL